MSNKNVVKKNQKKPLVVFDNVEKVYGDGDAAINALDGVSFKISEGDFLAFMGASGSGKSTTMNIMGCLDTPTSGTYFFNGVDINSLSRDQRALVRRHYLGFVFQGFNLLSRTTAIENLELPLIYRRIDKSIRRELSLAALEAVGLADRAHHTAAELSGGQQQRVAIARALVTNPSLLLADEPTGNLDTNRSKEIMDLLCQLNEERGITIVLITHEEDMANYARSLIQFRDGKITNKNGLRSSTVQC